jgi:hypothetical protein
MEAPTQRFQGVEKHSAGYRLLASMGWQEGEGLGKTKQGIKTHIRVKKKFENWGVGAVSAVALRALHTHMKVYLLTRPPSHNRPPCLWIL